jgi:hypothetical protein
MAYINLINGGSQPVFATDTLAGPQLSANTAYSPAGTPVNFMGPKLDFFGVGLGNSAFTQAGVNGAVQQILQQIQQVATVAMYQVDNTNNTVDFSVAIFPTGAYTAATLQAAIQGLGNIYNSSANTYCNVAAATVTSVGFRLASSATSAS